MGGTGKVGSALFGMATRVVSPLLSGVGLLFGSLPQFQGTKGGTLIRDLRGYLGVIWELLRYRDYIRYIEVPSTMYMDIGSQSFLGRAAWNPIPKAGANPKLSTLLTSLR